MSEKNIWDILNRNLFFIKNAIAKREAKTSDKFDVYDSESREVLLEWREPDIGPLTKVARWFGGRHDRGTAFNLVASTLGSKERVLRVTRGNASLSFGSPIVKISDHWDSLLGILKKKNLSFGIKFTFAPEKQGESFLLQIDGDEIFCDDKQVAIICKWDSAFFKEGKFDYGISISPEVPANSLIRQVLLAFAIAKHRIII